jgi:GLPGLI family protein
MKTLYISIFFLWFIAVNGQRFNCGKIIYTETFGTRNSLNYQLNFKNTISTYNKIFKENLNPNIETINGIIIPNVLPVFNFDATKNEMVYQVEISLNKIVVKDTVAILNWEMFSETKLVGDYNCLKAKTKIHDVDYTVWYTLEIPLVFGPWKLRGLPGLILEAYDSTNYYHISAEKIIFKDYCVETDQILNENKLLNPISWKAFVLKEKNEEKEIDEFYKSQQNRGDSSYIKTTISGFKREIIK